MLSFFEIILLVLLGISIILSIIRLILSFIIPDEPKEVKGCSVSGHYTYHVIGPVVCTIWHSDE